MGDMMSDEEDGKDNDNDLFIFKSIPKISSEWWIILKCGFSNVSSICWPKRMQSHIGCIYMIFRVYVFLNVFSNCLPDMKHNYTDCMFILRVFA